MASHAQFAVSRLRCVIGNNEALGKHNARYNGVYSIATPETDDNAFVPDYAGLNLEHYFDAGPQPDYNEVFFEPRCAPMSFEKIDDFTAELHQPPTPHYGVESWTRFVVKEPYYVDMAFRCVATKPDLAGGMLGVFWASYINAPLDKSVYFLGAGSTLDKPVWNQYCTQEHGRDSTVCHESATQPPAMEGGKGTLFKNLSPLRYSEPFFYGRFRENVLIFMFQPDPRIRFSHSPSGGGPTAAKDGYNPAWDFQFVVPEYEVGKEYSLTMRLAYKPWMDRADVIKEVRSYLGQ